MPGAGCRFRGPSFGFGENGAWLPQPEHFARYAADRQIDVSGSFHSLYRDALRIRREHFIAEAKLSWIDSGDDVLAYERGSGVRCVANMGDVAVPMPAGEILLASQPGLETELPADTAVWVRPPS